MPWKVNDRRTLPFRRFQCYISGRYVWSESHQLADYTNWGPGEPQQDEGFDCVFKSGDFIVGWHDYNCNQDVVSGDAWGLQIHALCETETNN